MDFRPWDNACHFIYCLPFSTTEALLEATWMTTAPIPWTLSERCLRTHIQQLCAGRTWTVIRTERGILPMHTVPTLADNHPRIIPIGARAGLSRPSSGYAFSAIQQNSATLADRLVHGEPVRYRLPWRRRTRFLDRVFSHYLNRHPQQAPDVFLKLFTHVDGDTVARFLCDRSTGLEDLRVIAALPTWPFLRETMAIAVGQWNRFDFPWTK